MIFFLLFFFIKNKINFNKLNLILKINKKKKILNIFNFRKKQNLNFINNYNCNYNKILLINCKKTNKNFINIPGIEKNSKLSKIISSIKYSILDNFYCDIEKILEIYLIKIQKIFFKYEEITSPLLINYSNLLYSGQIPNFFNEVFFLKKNKQILIPTSEVILNSLSFHIKNFNFPLKLICNSFCFRKEIGSIGINESGLKRQQQFKKIEIFQFTKKKNMIESIYSICSNLIFIFKKFKFKFRIIKIKNNDLNNSAFCTFDFEILDNNFTWIEISSVSICLNIPFYNLLKYKNICFMNASCLPIGRLIYLIFKYYRINNYLIKIPGNINYILTELLKW